jgi:hypothetical protein
MHMADKLRLPERSRPLLQIYFFGSSNVSVVLALETLRTTFLGIFVFKMCYKHLRCGSTLSELQPMTCDYEEELP